MDLGRFIGSRMKKYAWGEIIDMNEQEFMQICKAEVLRYTNKTLAKTDGIKVTMDDIYVVWVCKTLQNNKALLSTTVPDGMYYEITYNGNEHELYFDAYKKVENKCIKLSYE